MVTEDGYMISLAISQHYGSRPGTQDGYIVYDVFKLEIVDICRHTARFDFKKYRILEILIFHPCVNLIVNTYKNVDQLAGKKAKPRGYNTSSCSTQLSIIVFPAHNCSNVNTCWHFNIC